MCRWGSLVGQMTLANVSLWKNPEHLLLSQSRKVAFCDPALWLRPLLCSSQALHLHTLHQRLTLMGKTGLIINKDESNDGAPEFI